MDISLEILTTLLPTEIYPLIIFSGVVYLILIFYGTKQWEKYSDFDKVVFSVILGGFVWYFFIFPISIFVFTLNVFQKPEIIIPNDFPKYSYFIYFILAFYLIWWRLLKTNNRPLRDNNTFLKVTELLIVVTILLVALMDYALFVAFYFSTYREHLVYIMASVISLVAFLLNLYHIFLKIFPINESFFSYSDKLPDLNFIFKNKKLWALIILIISVAAALIGTYFLKTTTQLVDEKNTRLEIPRMETWKYRDNLTGYFDVEQNYKITFGLIPWVKIRPNISLIDKYGKPDSSETNYYVNGEYVIINGSSWNTNNFTLYGKKREDYLPKIYKIEKKDLNETVQRWDIIFTNPYDMYINIYIFDIEKDRQFNKLIRYNIIGLNFDKEALDETLKNQNQETVAIKDVGVRHKSLNLNQSITLFFEKNSTI